MNIRSNPYVYLRVVLARHTQHFGSARVLRRDVGVPERHGLLPTELEQGLPKAGVGAIERLSPELRGLRAKVKSVFHGLE